MPTQLSLAYEEPGDELFQHVEVRRGLPVRGFLTSIAVHSGILAISLLIPWNYWLPREQARIAYEVTMVHTDEPLYLPSLQPAPKVAREGAEGENGGHAGDAPVAPALPRVVHKGPQRIVSLPPNPDNEIQTIRQPELTKAPKFPVTLPVPNMVMMAPHVTRPTLVLPPKPELAQQPEPPRIRPASKLEPKAEIPVIQTKAETAAEIAKLMLPVVPPRAPEPPKEVPLPPHSAATQDTSGTDTKDLLVLNADPVDAKGKVQVPPGELHGAFIVSPTPPVAVPGGTGAGSAAKDKDKDKDKVAGAGAGNGAGNGHGGNGPGQGRGAGSGNGKGSGSGPGTGVKGKGPGAGSVGGGAGKPGGTEVAGGPNGGTGSGNGTGTGSPFPDIAVEGAPRTAKASGASGGAGGGGAIGKYSYGMTIVASGGSGGGFKDYGVFRNEAVYTVYVPMADAESWTMEYAAMPGEAGSASASVAPSQRILSAPYPMTKEAPHFAPELVARHSGRMIVLRAVITREGKLDGIRILQSPDPRLTDFILQTLEACSFHPAEVNGESVPAKVVIGIPIQ